ncbi:YhdP family protein [Aliiglaciecola sp. CAU 1673]|uniref:YhdP family protein n=1 Tax=Aliiglaciecola sp. CAU 1673 TaxID=3032595 RepID=UPI0023DAF713|nr:YhdP family protein [Aliiglaciecola sp. CAU 1673]MDF2179123.1 YhdP family protein [Aliiglaciecola sp. CAU 1673]
MKPLTPLLSYVLKKLWMLTAVVLVSLAVLLSLLRYSLPHMDSKKHWLEDYISQEYGAKLKIGRISAAWQGLGPAILLQDVSLNNQADSPIKLNIRETQIELDLLSSLLHRKIQSQRFNLVGLTLSLDIHELQSGDGDYPVVDALEELFLEQLQRFSVQESDIFVATANERQHIQIEQLSWLNKGDRHQGIGLMQVAELANNSASFILDLYGGADNLHGMFYADAEDLDISPWVQEFNPSNRQLTAARIDFTLWAEFSTSSTVAVQASLGNSLFSWQGEAPLEVRIEGGEFAARPDSQGWRFALSKLQMQLNDEAPFEMGMLGSQHHAEGLGLQIDPLNLEQLLPLTALVLDDEGMDSLKQMNLRTKLENIALWFGTDGAGLNLDFYDLGYEQHGLIPGLQQGRGNLSWLGNKGKLQLQAEQGVLQSHNLLEHDMPFDALGAEIFFDTKPNGLLVTAPDIFIDSEDLSARIAMAFNTDDSHLSLVSRIQPMQVANAKRLFPPSLMGKGTQAYLNRALVTGDLRNISLLWHGSLTDFPYTQNQGIFQAGVSIENGEFSFDQEWPSLSELKLDLLFENEALWMYSNEGRLRDLRIGEVKALIPVLSDTATLVIDIHADAEGEAVRDLMLNSALSDSVGAALDELRIDDMMHAQLRLDIPLSGTNVVATGKVSLPGNQTNVVSLGLPLDDLKGQIHFVNDKIESKDLRARLWDQPLSLSMQGKQGKEAYGANVTLQGKWDLDKLIAAYKPSMQQQIQGKSGWSADLSLKFPSEGYEYEFDLQSDLKDARLNMPVPLNKISDTEMPLHLNVTGNSQVSQVRAQLGNQVRFEGLLPHQEMRFSRAHLALGDSSFAGLGMGFSISADLTDVVFGQWHDTVESLLAGTTDSGNNIFPVPDRIFINADTLKILDVPLNKVQANIKYRDLAWLVSLNAEETRSELEISQDWLGRGLKIKTDYLNIPEFEHTDNQAEASTTGNAPDLKTMPPLEFECKRCTYGIYDLGKVSLKMSRHHQGMSIDRLDISRAGHKLSATGNWYNGGDTSTRLLGKFSSEDFGALLKDFGLDSGIRDSGADMDFDLSWQQAPYDFNFASLNGDVKWQLSDGYLSEVSDKGARLFSILSLESLVRKLTLDFRDVFAKGFFYDEMSGSFQIAQGRVHTKDTQIDGAAGKMSLTGYTDLNSKALNYDIAFVPKVTSSLPVILAWMVSPTTAIAAFALDEVLTSAKVISNIRYSLTGTLDEPVLEEKGRDSRDVELPAKAKPSNPKDQQSKPASEGING